MLTGPPVGTGRRVALPWQCVFLGLCLRRCIFWIFLSFVKTLRFRELVLGRFPSLVGNRLVFVVAQTRIPFFYAFLGCHRQHEVSMPASSEVRRHGRYITTDKSMYIDRWFYFRLSADLWNYGCQEFRKDSIDTACWLSHFVSCSWCARWWFFPVVQLV